MNDKGIEKNEGRKTGKEKETKKETKKEKATKSETTKGGKGNKAKDTQKGE